MNFSSFFFRYSLVGLSQSSKSKFLFPGSQTALTALQSYGSFTSTSTVTLLSCWNRPLFIGCWTWKPAVRLLSPDLARELICCSVLAFVVKPLNAHMQQTPVCVAVNEPLGRFAAFCAASLPESQMQNLRPGLTLRLNRQTFSCDYTCYCFYFRCPIIF